MITVREMVSRVTPAKNETEPRRAKAPEKKNNLDLGIVVLKPFKSLILPPFKNKLGRP